jgi:hypothetical protein
MMKPISFPSKSLIVVRTLWAVGIIAVFAACSSSGPSGTITTSVVTPGTQAHFANSASGQWAALIDAALKVSQILALGAAASWFYISAGASKRTQLDVQGRVCAKVTDGTLLEVTVLLENKGFVNHKVYDLSLTVRGAAQGQRFFGYADKNNAQYPHKGFNQPILEKAPLISPDEEWEWMFVRPGTRQAVARLVLVPTDIHLVVILALFTYRSERQTAKNMPHSALTYLNLEEAQSHRAKA